MQSRITLDGLSTLLSGAKTLSDKIAILDSYPKVASFLSAHPSSIFNQLAPQDAIVFKQLIAIGQAPQLEQMTISDARELAANLIPVDDFYREIGGIIGYQAQVLHLIHPEKAECSHVAYHSPSFYDISQTNEEVNAFIEAGIQAQPFLCEMYPLGGAADRLHLVDEQTGHELPAAKLKFANRTLLHGLLRDLLAREHLYFLRTGKTLTTPIAIMTSREKDNCFYVQQILEENHYFGRPKESFRLFVQPLVPAVTQTGDWLWTGNKLLLKPGGHGAIWKAAKDHGVFDWLRSLGVRYALIRQINNPLAGLDYGLLAFTGVGFSRKMSFGFASCPRLCLAAEGMNVLIERKTPHGFSYVISNIEYCDFAKYGMEDRPRIPNEPYSRFSSNTNILFAKLSALDDAVNKCPFPGLTINFKQNLSGVSVGRLESTMQNIADVFVEKKRTRLKENDVLKKTFVTYNHRHKTISTAKKALDPTRTLNETPENCFFDLMRAHRELLQDVCGLTLPPERSLEEELKSHPSFVFLFHPTLGPLFQLIGKKIRGGELKEGSELVLEIANTDFEKVSISGSLQVLASSPTFSRCVLHRVQVVNRGIDWEHSKPFWKGCYQRSESLVIAMEGHSEFIAEDICFDGNQRFVVSDGERLIVTKDGIRKETLSL